MVKYHTQITSFVFHDVEFILTISTIKHQERKKKIMEDFVKQLLTDKGVPSTLPEETYKQLVSDLSARATDLVNRHIVDAMSPEVLEQFEKILDNQPDNPDAVHDFIKKNVSNKEEIAARALLEFRALYLGEKA